MAGPFGHIRPTKGGRVQMNGVNMAQADWTGRYIGEDVNTNNFEALGFDQGTIGFRRFEFNSNGKWNAAANAFDAPGIFPTDLFPNAIFFINTVDTTNFTCQFARILSSENGATNLETGAVAFNFGGKSNGTFSIPTGSA